MKAKRRVAARRRRARSRVAAEGHSRKDRTRAVRAALLGFEENVRHLEYDLARGVCKTRYGGGAVGSYELAVAAATRVSSALERAGGFVSARTWARMVAARDRMRAAGLRFNRECVCGEAKR